MPTEMATDVFPQLSSISAQTAAQWSSVGFNEFLEL
jgi:hypothetical protein